MRFLALTWILFRARRTLRWAASIGRKTTVTLILFLLLAPQLAAQDLSRRVTFPGENLGLARRLEALGKLVQERQFTEAIDECQRIIDENADDLVPIHTKDQSYLVPARRACHVQLMKLPPPALKQYRDRVDGQAKKWLEQGKADLDPRPLRRLVEQAFCSRFGDEALDLLGDLALERGDIDEAASCWGQIVVPASAASAGRLENELIFPDPKVDIAQIRAKQILAGIFLGSKDAWQRELAAFRKLHASATGHLAGKEGKYVEILEAFTKQQLYLDFGPTGENWTTFAGSSERQRILPGRPNDPNRLTRLCLDPPQRFSLETRKLLGDERDRAALIHHKILPAAQLARSLAFHPLMVNDLAIVADDRHVVAFPLHGGTRPAWSYDLLLKHEGATSIHKLPADFDLRYTLTYDSGAIYARLGCTEFGPGLGSRRDTAGRGLQTYLVRLDLAHDGADISERWAVPAWAEKQPTFFEGAPVVRDNRVYIAATRFVNGDNITAIHCYPADDKSAPAPLWRQDVCSTRELKESDARSNSKNDSRRNTHHLLTMAGSKVVYCSHSGAVVALDAETGKRCWALRYPGRAPGAVERPTPPRSLLPPLYHAGRLYVAPADDDLLFCLDAASGRVLWDRDGIEVVHLLGVAKDRLIFCSSRGLRAVNSYDGSDRGGWAQPADSSKLPSYGRGFLAGDFVFWPTAEGIVVVNQEDGEQPYELNPWPLRERIQPGNLVFGYGCLVVATDKELHIYSPAGGRKKELEKMDPANSNSVNSRR